MNSRGARHTRTDHTNHAGVDDVDDQADDSHAPGPALLDAAQLQLRTAVEQLLTPEHVHLHRSDADPALDEQDRLEIARLEIVALGLAIRTRAAAADGHRARARTLLGQIDATRARQDRLQTAIRSRRAGTGLVPPLLDRLVDAVAASSNTGGAPSAGATRSILGLQAAHLVADIDLTTRWGRYTGDPTRSAVVRTRPVPLAGGRTGHAVTPVRDLPAQLRRWAARAPWWRAVHPHYLLDAAPLAQWWADQARAVLDTTAPLTLAGACPACGARTVTVDDAGWAMQQRALQIDRLTGTTRCLHCGQTWPVEHYPHLARVLEQDRLEHAAHRRAAAMLRTRGITGDDGDAAVVAGWLLTGHADPTVTDRAPRAELDDVAGQTA